VAVKVLVGPAGTGKTKRILQAFVREIREGGEPILLLPSSHRVGEVKRFLFSRGEPLGLDTIHTLESLVGALLEGTSYAYSCLNAIETQAVVEEVVRRVADRLEYFAEIGNRWGFARVVGRFLRDGVAWGKGLFPLDRVEPPEKARDLALILETYLEVMGEKGVLDESLALIRAASLVEQRASPRAKGVTHLLADGFYDFTTAQWTLMESLITRIPQVTFSLLYHARRPRLFFLPVVILEKLKALGATLEEVSLEGKWPLSPLEGAFSGDGKPEGTCQALEGRVGLIQGSGKLGEVRWVAHEVASLLRGGVKPEDIGVVVKDMGAYRGELEGAFEAWNIPFRVVQHPALAEHPLVNLVVMLMKTRLEDLPVSRLVSLALSSLIRLDPSTREEVLRLVDMVQYLLGIERWRLKVLKERDFPKARGWIITTLIPALEAIPLRGEGREIMEGLDRSLELLGMGRDGEGERILAYLWEALLWVVRGKGLAGINRFTLEEFLISVAGVLKESHYSSLQPQGGVTVMGLLDGRQSTFPYLFFMGLNQGIFPSQVYSDPLLRDGDRDRINRAYGRVILPLGGEKTLAEDRLLFYVGFTRAKEVLYLSYSCRDDQGRPLLPSPYLVEILRRAEPIIIQGRPPYPLPPGRSIFMEETPLKDLPLPRVFTPTQVETYAQCPYAFFLCFLLEIAPFRVPVEEALDTYIGELYHHVLERYEKARGKGEGGGLKENLGLLERIAREVFRKYEEEGKVGHQALFRAERERHLGVLRDFVRWETEREEAPPFLVEEDLKGEYRDFSLKGRVDRVQKEDGGMAIWDYKVGQGHDYREKGRKGLLFQPYIYAHLLNQRGIACALFRYLFLPNIQNNERGVLEIDLSGEAMKAQMDRVVELVEAMKRGYFSPYSREIGLEESGGKCRRCPYRLICRREDKVLGW